MKRLKKHITETNLIPFDESLVEDPSFDAWVNVWLRTACKYFEERHIQYKVESVAVDVTNDVPYFTLKQLCLVVTITGVLR